MQLCPTVTVADPEYGAPPLSDDPPRQGPDRVQPTSEAQLPAVTSMGMLSDAAAAASVDTRRMGRMRCSGRMLFTRAGAVYVCVCVASRSA